MPAVPEVQTVIRAWSAQASVHAICDEVPWLLVQLPSGVVHHGIPGKRLHPFQLPAELTLPVFTGARDIVLRWDRYIHVACIVHHGDHLAAGHFTVVLRRNSSFWQYDDDERAAPATCNQLVHASRNVYGMHLIRADLISPASQLGSDLRVPVLSQGTAVDHVAPQRGENSSAAGISSSSDQCIQGQASAEAQPKAGTLVCKLDTLDD